MSDYWKESEKLASEPVPSTRPPVLYPLNEVLLRKARNGARWPWWLAGITVVNMILAWVQAPIRFSFGLAIPEILFEVGRAIGPLTQISAVGFDGIFLGFLVALGFLNRRFAIWAYITTIIILSIDTLAVGWLAWVGNPRILSLVLHLVSIGSAYTGMQAAKLLLKRKAQGIWDRDSNRNEHLRHERPADGRPLRRGKVGRNVAGRFGFALTPF